MDQGWLPDDECADQVRPVMGAEQGYARPVRLGHQMDRPEIEALDERGEIGGVLGHCIVASRLIPLCGEMKAATVGNDAIPLSEDRHLIRPGAIVAEGAVDQDHRFAFSLHNVVQFGTLDRHRCRLQCALHGYLLNRMLAEKPPLAQTPRKSP